jgi:ribonucleoside-diphosphate reductase alpha chain
MLETAEPGFSIDLGISGRETLRNACTEITSKDSDDICNLGSINLGQIDTIEEFRRVVHLGTLFLLAGTIYSDLPYYDVEKVRSKNRRLGLGLMGIHEWLLKRGKKYGQDDELGVWLDEYRKESRQAANEYADQLKISRPKKVRAIAPTGTISIVAETSSGIEPLFCVAYKRRYLKGGKYWAYQHVVDPVARRLADQGVDPNTIEDAYSISEDVERRVAFQAWVQEFVDHGISSTINLPHWGSEWNNENRVKNFGNMLIKYLPRLRGLTCYPDGSRGGQPLTPVPLEVAMRDEGIERIESGTDVCGITGKGSCGD